MVREASKPADIYIYIFFFFCKLAHSTISSKANRSYDFCKGEKEETDQNLNLNFVAVDIFKPEDNRVITALKRVFHSDSSN